MATSPQRSPLATIPPRSPMATSPQRSPLATSPQRSPLATSPQRSPLATSPQRRPMATSPQRSPLATSPQRSPMATSPQRSPQRSPMATSPQRSPLVTSPYRGPQDTSPQRSLQDTSLYRGPQDTSPYRPQSISPFRSPTLSDRSTTNSTHHDDDSENSLSDFSHGTVTPSPMRSPMATSPQRNPLATSPQRSPLVTSPPRSPMDTSPQRNPLATSPQRSPLVTSPPRSPMDTSPQRSPMDTSPPRSPMATSPYRAPRDTSPQRSLQDTSLYRGPQDTSPYRPQSISPSISPFRSPTLSDRSMTNSAHHDDDSENSLSDFSHGTVTSVEDLQESSWEHPADGAIEEELDTSCTETPSGEEYRPGQHDHCHPPELGATVNARVNAGIRVKGPQQIFEPASNLVDDLLLEVGDQPGLPTHEALLRRVNRAKANLRPAEPTDFNFELDMDNVPEGYVLKDIEVQGNRRLRRHLLLATQLQLSILASARTWYIDGTFKIVRAPFTQVLSLHAFLQNGGNIKQVPLAFAVMSGRKKGDYRAVFSELIDALPGVINLQECVLDFESALWQVLPQLFPHVRLRGCSFHWAQAVWRHAQQLGLQVPYKEDERVHRWLRRLLALPYLPVAAIPQALTELQSKVRESRVLTELAGYVERTWLHSSAWPPRCWSVYGRSIRTNNDVEGWHNRL
ncbi:PREDICTED: mucin-17-like [Branchiostoma belcheri]|uniref:Mucin-17-like n=1 Tax=Branchiostoma belcheri TaxID=7741 RepID=A0A6P4ZEG3_BRABE|nr:PREDICTED: mucin-17-like [Branchiostoma belcheri]